MEGSQFYTEMIKKDALESIGEVVQELTKAKNDDFEKRKLSSSTRRHFAYLLHLYFLYKNHKFRTAIGDQLPKYHVGQICSEYLDALTAHGRDSPISGYDAESTMIIRMICVNYSDASSEFAMELRRVELFPILVDELETFKGRVNDAEIIKAIIDLSLITLHNCAKVSENKKWVRVDNIVDAIYPYTEVECKEIKMVAILTLAQISNEKNDQKIYADKSITAFILESLKLAIEDEKHVTRGYTAHEIVLGIKCLALNDENKLNTVHQGVLELLQNLLEKGDEAEKEVCTATIMKLVFMDENKEKVRSHSELMDILRNLSKEQSEAGNNARSALFMLEGDGKGVSNILHVTNYYVNAQNAGEVNIIVGNQNQAPVEPPLAEPAVMGQAEVNQQPPGEGGHIMLSYSHRSSEGLASQISSELTRKNYKVWIDIHHMRGNLLQTLAEAVQNAYVVLIFPSQSYEESRWCRLAAGYALHKGKPIIPIKSENDYEPSGWLGLLQSQEYHVDFTDGEKFDGSFENLLRQLSYLE